LGSPRPGELFYPTRINKGVEVVDKEKSGLVPLSKYVLSHPEMMDTRTFWDSLWETLLWRSILMCSDTNMTNILWSESLNRCVSVDEMYSINPEQRLRKSVSVLFAKAISPSKEAQFMDFFDRQECLNTLDRWDRVLRECKVDEDSPIMEQMVNRLRLNIAWLRPRVQASFQ
jgi:hypothetical protein